MSGRHREEKNVPAKPQDAPLTGPSFPCTTPFSRLSRPVTTAPRPCESATPGEGRRDLVPLAASSADLASPSLSAFRTHRNESSPVPFTHTTPPPPPPTPIRHQTPRRTAQIPPLGTRRSSATSSPRQPPRTAHTFRPLTTQPPQTSLSSPSPCSVPPRRPSTTRPSRRGARVRRWSQNTGGRGPRPLRPRSSASSRRRSTRARR